MDILSKDKNYIWHPFTQMKTQGEILPVKKAKGAKIYLEDGRELIDCISSWWVNIHGHAQPYIAAKIAEQAAELEHVIFAGFTHRPAADLAERLLKILPGNPSKIFFSDNGSTSVEVALKMCRQYFYNKGEHRKKFIAFENAYHGDTFGAMSVGGRSTFNVPFEELFFDVEFIPLPDGKNNAAIIEKLKELFAKEDYAAFIFEPMVQGSAGMLMYDAGDLDAIVSFCRKSGLLVVADEVFTGFGRTGKMFACDYLHEQPDIVCVSKGITGGFLPLGITACRAFIYEAFYSDDKHKALYHGHSYTANPIACAAANASLDLFDDNTMKNIERIAQAHLRFVPCIEKGKNIRNVRCRGTILAVEFETGSDASYYSAIRDKLYAYFIKKGLLMRPLGNVVYLVPPYCISDEELAAAYDAIRELSDQPLTSLL